MAATRQGRRILHNKEVRHTSGHLSEPTGTNGTARFRQHSEAETKEREMNKQMKLIPEKQNRLSSCQGSISDLALN
jgi:hypothetical protein